MQDRRVRAEDSRWGIREILELGSGEKKSMIWYRRRACVWERVSRGVVGTGDVRRVWMLVFIRDVIRGLLRVFRVMWRAQLE